MLPERIYICEDHEADQTWLDHQFRGNSVEYVRADLAEKQQAEEQRFKAALAALSGLATFPGIWDVSLDHAAKEAWALADAFMANKTADPRRELHHGQVPETKVGADSEHCQG